MALEEVVDSLEGISEEYKDLYVKGEDGKFKIDIGGLKSAVQKERNLRKTLEKKVLKKDDNTPDVDEVVKELETAKKEIRQMKIGSKVKNTALSAGIDADYVDDVIALTRHNFDLDDEGNVVHLGDDKQPSGLTVEKFFNNSFKSAKPRFYVSSGRQGGGAQNDLSNAGPLSHSGKIQKAREAGDIKTIIDLKMSKIKK